MARDLGEFDAIVAGLTTISNHEDGGQASSHHANRTRTLYRFFRPFPKSTSTSFW